MVAAALAEEARDRERLPVEHIIIQVGDELDLVDFANSGMGDSTEAVAADGKVLVPGAGWVHVAGLTREDAEHAITQALQPFYERIDVKVKVRREAH